MSEASNFDILWIVIAAALVMLMQGGFTLLETGMVRAKNSINVAIKNFVDFCLSGMVFWLVGFGIMFGASSGGWFGTSRFMFGEGATPYLLAFFLFQLVFAGTTTTIVSGAVAERMRFAGYVATSLVIMTLIYPVVGHWIWGGLEVGETTGWLAKRGFIDFAGSTVVHSVGAWVALAAVLILGARKGRFEAHGSTFAANNLPLAAMGGLMLWFGWFGFNGGSTLRVSDDIPLIVVNTVLAGAIGGVVGVILSWSILGRPEVGATINGALAGLVGVTASAHIQTPVTSIIIGLVASTLAFIVENLFVRLKIDDAVGAFPVHGVAGIWGTMAVALFGDVSAFGGLSRMGQLVVQLTGIGAVFAYAFGLGFILLWMINWIVPLRVSSEDEEVGLNVAEHGARTALATLLREMGEQRDAGDLAMRVTVEPFTEVGEFALAYNGMLDQIQGMVSEAEANNRELQQSIFELLDDVAGIAEGDLTQEATVTDGTLGAIADSFNFMTEAMRDIIGQVQQASATLYSTVGQVQSTSENLAQGSELQAAQIVDTSAAIDEMAISIQQVSETSAMSATVGEQARVNAQRGTEAVRNTIQGMNRIRSQVQDTSKRIQRLGDSSQRVGEIVTLIDDIADRTSILALNATIQAQLAGEAGKSFVVVAEEVEELADRATQATQQIEVLVRNMQLEVEEAIVAMEVTAKEATEGTHIANEAGQRLNEIESVSERLADLIRDISRAAQQQARGSETIAASMNDIATVTRQTATGTQDTTASIRNMAELAEELQDAVSMFQVGSASQVA